MTMDVREKLVEIIADGLIAHGVTVRECKIVADYPFCHCGAKMSAEEVPNG